MPWHSSPLYATFLGVCHLLAPVMPFITEHVYQNLVRAVLPDAPVCLHLTNFPEPDSALAHPDLEADVEAARRVLRVGLAARQTQGADSGGPSWWLPPMWSAPCEPSSSISSTS